MKPPSLDLSSQSLKRAITTRQESEAEFPSLEEYITSLKEREKNKKHFSYAFTNADQLTTLAKLTSQQILKLRSDGKQIDGILSLGSRSSKSPNGEFFFSDCLEKLIYYYTIQDDPKNSFKVANIGLEAEGYESRSEKFNYVQKIQLIPVDRESEDFQEEVDKILPKNCKNIILMLNHPESFVMCLTEEYIKRGGKYIVGTAFDKLHEDSHCESELYKKSPNFDLLKGKKIEDQSEFECNDEIELPEYLKVLDEDCCDCYYSSLQNSLSTSIPISFDQYRCECFILIGEFDHKLFLENWKKNTPTIHQTPRQSLTEPPFELMHQMEIMGILSQNPSTSSAKTNTR